MNSLKQLASRLMGRGNPDTPDSTRESRAFNWEAPLAADRPPRAAHEGPSGRPGSETAGIPGEKPGREVRSKVPAGRSDPERARGKGPAEGGDPGRGVRWRAAATVTDFSVVYKEAGIEPPPHGYGVDKLHDMLRSPHLTAMPREMRTTAVLVALETARVPLRDVIDDALLRSKALTAFEADKALELQATKARAEGRSQVLREQVDAFLREKNAEIERLKRGAEAAAQSLVQLQSRKRREQERLFRVATHFVEPRPALASPAPVTPKPVVTPTPPSAPPAAAPASGASGAAPASGTTATAPAAGTPGAQAPVPAPPGAGRSEPARPTSPPPSSPTAAAEGAAGSPKPAQAAAAAAVPSNKPGTV